LTIRRLLVCFALAALAVAPAATPAQAPIHFSTFVTTDLPLGEVQWTGREFLYNAENLGKLEVSDAKGGNIRTFATFDQGGEEMRCRVPTVKYWPDGVYCHTPDNRIVRFNRDGTGLTEIARLPGNENSDGAIAFDTVGRFGYGLVAATGGSASNGGEVYVVRTSGKVTLVGGYPGGGGAENIAIAPARFGRHGGSVLIAIDEDHVQGRVLAMDRKGKVEPIATGLGNGINPIVVVEASPAKRAAGSPAAGAYFSDTLTKAVWFAPAAALKQYAGGVMVGSELQGDFWIVRPKGNGFEKVALASDLPRQPWNFEGACYVR
jgi:hypothetical protein